MTAALAEADARRCIRDCPTLRVRRVSLTARLDALDAEAGEVRRYQTIEDSNAEHRETASDDPVTARLAVLYGIADVRLDLFAGLVFASVLEGVACLLWWIALSGPKAAPVTSSFEAVTFDSTVPIPAVTEQETEVTKLARDIAAGLVRPTVSGIRRDLGCSQAKAASLRKQIVSSSL